MTTERSEVDVMFLINGPTLKGGLLKGLINLNGATILKEKEVAHHQLAHCFIQQYKNI